MGMDPFVLLVVRQFTTAKPQKDSKSTSQEPATQIYCASCAFLWLSCFRDCPAEIATLNPGFYAGILALRRYNSKTDEQYCISA
jgi:hypothetical protein